MPFSVVFVIRIMTDAIIMTTIREITGASRQTRASTSTKKADTAMRMSTRDIFFSDEKEQAEKAFAHSHAKDDIRFVEFMLCIDVLMLFSPSEMFIIDFD